MKEKFLDENGFQSIFETYFEPICKFLNLYTKDKDVIEDIVQEVFCNLWINRDFLKVTHLKSYLYASARNKALNYIRDEKLHSSILANYMIEEKVLQEAYDCVNKEEFNAKLDNAISNLPDKCKKVFKLSRFKKLSYKEIAEEENISVKMVEKHISVALKKIRETMTFILF